MDAFNVNSATEVTNYVTINKAWACFQIVPRAAARAETSPSSDGHQVSLKPATDFEAVKSHSFHLFSRASCVYISSGCLTENYGFCGSSNVVKFIL